MTENCANSNTRCRDWHVNGDKNDQSITRDSIIAVMEVNSKNSISSSKFLLLENDFYSEANPRIPPPPGHIFRLVLTLRDLPVSWSLIVILWVIGQGN